MPAEIKYRDKIFWDVDTQVDFVLPEGKLYAPGAERLVPHLERLTQYAQQRHILVVASTDAHLPQDQEFTQWPPHCLAGTPGQRKIAQTQISPQFVVPNRPVDLPAEIGAFAQIVIEKQAVDVFSNPNVDTLLLRLGRPEITLYGLVTEVCVSCAAAGLLDRGYRLRIVADAIHPFNEDQGRQTLSGLQNRGAQLVTVAQVLSA
jgi:nicotinamidase/pyrazinamidase